VTPAERRARFRRILAQAVARADREREEHLDRLRPQPAVKRRPGWAFKKHPGVRADA
jgi:hypothetical protein